MKESLLWFPKKAVTHFSKKPLKFVKGILGIICERISRRIYGLEKFLNQYLEKFLKKSQTKF